MAGAPKKHAERMVTVTIRLPRSVHRKLRVMAFDEEVPMRELVERMVRWGISENEVK